MLTITPAENTPEVVKNRFTTEPAANNHGYTSAFYAIDTKNKYKYLIEVLTGPRPFYVITAADQYTKYIICFEQKSPRTIDIRHAEVYKNCSNYPERREEAPRLLKKYSFIACLLYGLIKNGEAPAGATEEQPAEIITTGKPYPVILYRINAAARFMILAKNNSVWIDGPAAELEAHKNEIRKTEPAAAFTDETGARYVFRIYDSWTVYAAILREYTITAATEEAAKETARALAAGQPYSINKAYQAEPANDPEPVKAADERPKRRTAYRVECRSPRGSWTTYSDEQPSREDAARIMEEAENRNTRTTDGAPVFYRIVQIDKGPATPDPLPKESTPESCRQDESRRRYTIYTDSSAAGIDSRGAYKTLAEARMRLEKELDEDETSRGGYIYDEERQKVTAIYNYFNIDKIPEPYRGTPNEYTTRKERERLAAALETIRRAEEAATSAGPAAEDETPTNGETAQQDSTSAPTKASSESTPEENTTTGSRDSVNKAATAEKAPGRPETSTPAQDTTGSETRPPRAADKPTKAAQIITTDADKAHQKQTTRPGATTPGPAATRPAGTAGKGPPAPTKDAPQATQRAGKSHTGQTHHEPRHAPPRARETAKRPPADGEKSYKQWKIGFFQDHHENKSPLWKDTRLCGYRVDNPQK